MINLESLSGQGFVMLVTATLWVGWAIVDLINNREE